MCIRDSSWDEEEIKKYLEQSAEAEEIPPELETENMRKYIKTQTTGEQQKKHKNITGNIKHWYPAVTAACLCIIPVSYTHLDVYKRQDDRSGSVYLLWSRTDF